jgi:hypothetical protein
MRCVPAGGPGIAATRSSCPGFCGNPAYRRQHPTKTCRRSSGWGETVGRLPWSRWVHESSRSSGGKRLHAELKTSARLSGAGRTEHDARRWRLDGSPKPQPQRCLRGSRTSGRPHVLPSPLPAPPCPFIVHPFPPPPRSDDASSTPSTSPLLSALASVRLLRSNL